MFGNRAIYHDGWGFLLHMLPRGFHRIRHYGPLACHVRNDNLVRARTLLDNSSNPNSTATVTNSGKDDSPRNPYLCPTCGVPMLIIETFEPIPAARDPPRLRNAA